MTVPNIPFLLSQAGAEFGGTFASQIMANAGLGATGLVSRLAGMTRFQQIAQIQSIVTGNNTPPFAWFTYDSATNQTIYIYLDSITIRSYPIFNGRAWVRIRNGGVEYVNCTEARWYLTDRTPRGVLNQTKGTVRSQVYEFSATEGGTIVYSTTAALNHI